MSPEFSEIIAKLINSPPAQLAAGAVLAGTVWKVFERTENLLSGTTKFEVAVWLVGLDLGKKVINWPSTFSRVFDRVFGERHLSWKCFGRSCLTSFISVVVLVLMSSRQRKALVITYSCPDRSFYHFSS
jgi:hypothetical protein